MINGIKNREVVLNILSDRKPHYSREFVNAGLLEYRKRISELRTQGYEIVSMKLMDLALHVKRPAYRLIALPGERKEYQMEMAI